MCGKDTEWWNQGDTFALTSNQTKNAQKMSCVSAAHRWILVGSSSGPILVSRNGNVGNPIACSMLPKAVQDELRVLRGSDSRAVVMEVEIG